MPNKYYSKNIDVPVKSQPMPPNPGTTGVKDAAPSFTPVSEEPKKGLTS